MSTHHDRPSIIEAMTRSLDRKIYGERPMEQVNKHKEHTGWGNFKKSITEWISVEKNMYMLLAGSFILLILLNNKNNINRI